MPYNIQYAHIFYSLLLCAVCSYYSKFHANNLTPPNDKHQKMSLLEGNDSQEQN